MSRTGKIVQAVLLVLAAIGLVFFVLADTAWVERRELIVSYLLLVVGGCMFFYAASTAEGMQRHWRSARYLRASRRFAHSVWILRALGDLGLVWFCVRALQMFYS